MDALREAGCTSLPGTWLPKSAPSPWARLLVAVTDVPGGCCLRPLGSVPSHRPLLAPAGWGARGCVVLCCSEVSNPGRNHQEKCSFGQKFRSILKAFLLLCLGFPSVWKAGKENKINTQKSSRRAFFPICSPCSYSSMEDRGEKGFKQGGILSFPCEVPRTWCGWHGVGWGQRGAELQHRSRVGSNAGCWIHHQASARSQISRAPSVLSWQIWKELFKTRLF